MNENYLLESNRGRLSEVSKSIKEKNVLMEEWEKESKNILLPAERWGENRRTASIFSVWSYIIFAFSIIFIIPLFFVIPYSMVVFKRRKDIRDNLSKSINSINSVIPIPLNKEAYKELTGTKEGKRLVSDNVVFEKGIHSMQTLINQ